MPMGTDRRSVLTGLGALGLMGCGDASEIDVTLFDYPIDLSALEARHGGRLGFCAYGRKGRLHWRGDERFVYCSTFKMYLAAATLLRVQAGEERLDRPVPVTRADMVNHAPVTEPAIGKTLTVETLMKAIVEVSDNPAANLLLKALGGIEAMRAFYRGIGDASTTVDRFEPEMNRLDGDKDTITPLQSAANISRLFLDSSTPLSAASRTLLQGWLFTSPTGLGRIKAGVPAGWRVEHKTGTGGYGPTNDIGLVYPPFSDPVVVAAYFHATGDSTDAQREAVIADATRIALSALGNA